MFALLRRMETWVHQHVFKVGWLVTQNYQTTTILYYAFFLPGVLLHELTYWLAAGAVNVRAERSIKWPEKQEVGELKLNFIQISTRAGIYRRAIISIMPLAVGILSIWWISANIYDLQAVVSVMSTGDLNDVAEAIQLLLHAPNFWLWAYVIFTVGNTMFPQIPRDLRGWRTLLLIAGSIVVVLTIIGLGGEIFQALNTPLNSLFEVLESALVLILLTDFLVVLILGTIEYAIERYTGRSASFKAGKMVTMTREQVLEETKKQRERERRRSERRKILPGESVPKSVYALAFPLPGAPGIEQFTSMGEPTSSTENLIAGQIPAQESSGTAPAPLPRIGTGISAKPEPAKINQPAPITAMDAADQSDPHHSEPDAQAAPVELSAEPDQLSADPITSDDQDRKQADTAESLIDDDEDFDDYESDEFDEVDVDDVDDDELPEL